MCPKPIKYYKAKTKKDTEKVKSNQKGIQHSKKNEVKKDTDIFDSDKSKDYSAKVNQNPAFEILPRKLRSRTIPGHNPHSLSPILRLSLLHLFHLIKVIIPLSYLRLRSLLILFILMKQPLRRGKMILEKLSLL